MRAFLMAATAAALAFPAAAQVPDAAKVRAAYERLCTGDAPGSEATCSALRDELDKAGVPGTEGWAGWMVGAPDDGTKAVRLYSVLSDGPAARAGLRTGDLIVGVLGRPVSDMKSYQQQLGHPLAGQNLPLRVVRGEQILDVTVKLADRPKPVPKLNSQRTDRGHYSLWSGSAMTVDKVRVGEEFAGILEDSDATSDWGKREDCIEVAEPGPGKNLVAYLTPNGTTMNIHVLQGQCALGVAPAATAYGVDTKKPFGINFSTRPGSKTYLMVSGASSAQPYHVIVREQTPRETVAWGEQVRQSQIAAEQQRQANERAAADRRAMWGAALTGLVSGFAGVEAPLMREDGSAPNLLETLNAANAALERKNAEGAARLNDTIARAQAQGEWQRRQREEADREADAQRQAERQRKDRELATQVIGQGRQQIQQTLDQARASGDKALEQRALQALQTNEAYAREKGVGAEVRQYAGQGKLGQTPLGGFPDPVRAPKDRTPPPASAERQQFAEAKVCLEQTDPGPRNCKSKDGTDSGSGRRPVQGGPGGGQGGALAGGTGSVPSRPTPPALKPPGTVASVEYETRREGVTLCELKGPQAKFNNWTCVGPLQMNYVNFEKPNWQSEMRMTCGGDNPVRDLGTAGGYRAFGCNFAINGPDNDIPIRFGVGYVPDRRTFRCRKDRVACQQ